MIEIGTYLAPPTLVAEGFEDLTDAQVDTAYKLFELFILRATADLGWEEFPAFAARIARERFDLTLDFTWTGERVGQPARKAAVVSMIGLRLSFIEAESDSAARIDSAHFWVQSWKRARSAAWRETQRRQGLRL